MFHIVVILAFIFMVTSPYVHGKDIVYAGLESNAYHVKLLKHALSYLPDNNYHVKGFGSDIPKARAFDLMANYDGIDVMIGTSTAKRESLYLPIRFPILKGLNGWRVALVNKGSSDLFANIKSEEAFKRLIPGQFHAWTDTKILESNGIHVAKGTDYNGLFQMLHKNRFDYFPRSVLEVYNELERYPELNLTLDSHVLIKYPMAYYFYVNKTNYQLAKHIHAGLEKALADGSFNRLFLEAHGDVLRKVSANKRRVFQLNNPLLVESTPIHRKELWVQALLNSTP